MKMVKKILLGLTAAAVIFGLAGCKRDVAGNPDIISVSFASKQASSAYSNGTNAVTRGFKTLNNDHLDAICHIENTVNVMTDAQKTSYLTNGVMGVVFNSVKDTAAHKRSFSIAAVRYNQSNNTVEAYVETFKDIDESRLEDELAPGTKASGMPDYVTNNGREGFGFTLLSSAQVNQILNAQTTTPKKIDIWIDIVANNHMATGRMGASGTYTVSFYKADPRRTKGSDNSLTYPGYDANNSIKIGNSYTIETTEVNNKINRNSSGGLSNMQADIGFYANVAPGQTLTGKWIFDAIKMEAEEIEE